MEETVLFTSFLFTIALIFVQVIFRYVLMNSLSWSEELARYVFVWQVWIGAAWAAKLDKHINITAFRDKFPDKAIVFMEVVVMLLWFAFSVFTAYWGCNIVSKIFRMGQKSAALQIPMGIPYLAVPVGSFLMAFRLVERFIRTLPRWKNRWNGKGEDA